MRLIDADALRAEWLGAVGEYTGNEILSSIDDMPTISREMSAKEFAAVRDRLCNSMNECTSCPIYKACLANSLVKVLPMIEEFAREHPERSEANDER